MCKEHTIALKTVNDMIKQSEEFSFDELQSKIINKGGILRISPGFTVGQYIIELEEDGVIKYNPKKEKFQVIERNLINSIDN